MQLTEDHVQEATAKAAAELTWMVLRTGELDTADAQRVMLRFLVNSTATPESWERENAPAHDAATARR